MKEFGDFGGGGSNEGGHFEEVEGSQGFGRIKGVGCLRGLGCLTLKVWMGLEVLDGLRCSGGVFHGRGVGGV